MAKFYFSSNETKGLGANVEFCLGQGLTTDDLREAATLLLRRNYPEIAYFKTGQQIGVVFVPEHYIPSKPRIVDPRDPKVPLRNFYKDPTKTEKDKKRLEGELRKAGGDLIELEVYEALQQCLKGKQENVLVIASLDIDGAYFGCKRQEFDFLIINESRQYILEIEVKKFLGPYDPDPNRKTEPEDPSIKAAKQLKSRKSLIHDIFGASIQGRNWSYISACACQKDKRKCFATCQ